MIYIDKTSSKPIYEQLYEELVRRVLSGAFPAESFLPSTRKLAEELSVSRNTVNRAYQQLVDEGYINPRAGSGYSVNNIQNPEMISADEHSFRPITVKESVRYDFDYGNIDNSTFPYREWRKSVNCVLDKAAVAQGIMYPDFRGEAALREEIARYLYCSRGVKCDPGQVIITCGHQHSVEIIAGIFESGSKRCAMEDPGYDGIRAVFANHRYEMSYIDVENDGIDVRRIMEQRVDLLYVTPSHQFPTGAVLSIFKRFQLLDWAFRNDVYIIEDDYDSELRYHTAPVPAMQSLDRHERVIYTGTFSKALSPAVRVAYIVFPYRILQEFERRYRLYGSQVSPLHQLALADFMETGCFERNINRLRTIYRQKQNVLKYALEKTFGENIKVSGDGAGLHLLVDIDTDIPPEILIEKAEVIEVKLYPVKPYYADIEKMPRCQLQFGFPTIDIDEFEKILGKLKDEWGI